MKKHRIENHLGKIIFAIGVLGVGAGITVLCTYWQEFGNSFSTDHARWSQFGDYIGGTLGSIFAFLALIALLLTLWLQNRELRISSEELKKSAKALKDQNESLVLQNFENRFFNMLTLHHQIVSGLDLRKNGKITASGRDCLKVFYDRLQKELKSNFRWDSIDYKKQVIAGYEKFYRQHSHELGHYYRYIYRILKFINESQISEKRDYSGILRAQLSNPELALLFYNGITSRGNKLKPLAEKYALFENLEPTQLTNMEEDSKLYSIEAFGDQAQKFKNKENG